jgi:hypothetical protein
MSCHGTPSNEGRNLLLRSALTFPDLTKPARPPRARRIEGQFYIPRLSGKWSSVPGAGQADDDKLRKLAPTGLSSKAIGIRMNQTESAVRSRARQLQVILRKIGLEQLQMG